MPCLYNGRFFHQKGNKTLFHDKYVIIHDTDRIFHDKPIIGIAIALS
jgi:hypothetical protein